MTGQPAARADLLTLTTDALAALANRGLTRRAAREVEEGKGPDIAFDEDGAVTGRFADGTTVTLTVHTPLERTHCTCPASGVCRHRLATVLAYQSQYKQPEEQDDHDPAAQRWSPANFTDAELKAHVGTRTIAAARRAHRAGYRARIRRPTPADPVPTVGLGSCTVRFLVPNELGYAHTDAARGARDDAVVLAVSAYRSADDTHPGVDVVDLDIGGNPTVDADGDAASGLHGALDLVEDILTHGAAHLGPAIGASIARARSEANGRNLRWIVDALDDLADQLDAYRARSARYDAQRLAHLLAEITARHRCAIGGGASLRSQVLGTEEEAETPLRRLRLSGLGCRITGDPHHRTVRIFLAHAEASHVLVLHRRWELDDDQPTGDELATRRIAGSTIGGLAAGNLVTESAVRSARRMVRIASNRVAKTTVANSAGQWQDLPETILTRDLNSLAAELAGLAPRLVRPRVEADLVRVIAVSDVSDISYRPGDQRLIARLSGVDAGVAFLEANHSGICPGALDAVTDALEGRHGAVRYVSGIVHRSRTEVVVNPLAIVAGSTVIVPDLAPLAGGPTIAAQQRGPVEPIVSALDQALAVTAEIAHRGSANLPPSFAQRARTAADVLRRTGLRTAAASVDRLITASTRQDGITRAWADMHIRLLCTGEQL